jgi:hypothetical protein
MSAFVLSHEEINLIVTWLTGLRAWQVYGRKLEEYLGARPSTDAKLHDLGSKLHGMNVSAVMQRYPGSTEDNLPGPIDPGPYKYKPQMAPMFRAYERLGSYMYQCSEGNVPDTRLYEIMDGIYNHMAHRLRGPPTRRTPGRSTKEHPGANVPGRKS